MATASQGEYGSTGGGLLRFDRRTRAIEKIELREIAIGFLRVGLRLLIATDFGIAVWEDGKLRRFFADRMTNGGLRVVEAIVAQ